MKITNKKILAATLSLGLILAGCGKDQKAEEKPAKTETTETAEAPAEKEESTKTANQEDYDFSVVSREEGSGTRGAFIELVGIEEEVDGSKEDMTTQEAIVQNSTNGVMQTVSQDTEAIGYISLGSLNDTVKAVKIEGVEATEENIVNGTYKISRPFNLAFKEAEINDLAKDFLKFCLSEQAQTLTLEEGYVPLKDTEKYEPAKVSGTLTVAGSTSVTPLMQKMAEKYQELNPDAKIEIQSTGSSAGIEAVIDGAADIAMASRELKDEEKDKLAVEVIATDGIAVVVNPSSKVEDLTMDELKQIFKGELRNTSELGK
ncbi:substrate-binding domain-containing protein [Anaerococcus degeneri]|uniref:Extracellular solute-binding protein n=1 Tax=Anaerococcus degeneri TaxID=361500 RepID=A0ABS7YZ91_9FIRM|nr:substrate-binding domain-containing protein [Anaerococcus degeneri]MBP2015475.1 phosphate transport system substrate-binding protein [Anaerococcus degeneri]MCA2095831.1 extracellular solute-binding protein [Anaerococcus degeneri]